MSHSYLDFADFDAAYRYSSTPSIATAELQPLTAPGKPTLIHIRAPASRSLPLSLANPSSGSVVSRRRAQSDTTASSYLKADTEVEVGAGAERPISAILVSFAPIDWAGAAAAATEPHPGTPASIASVEDVEAVSPKSKVPRVLLRVLQRTTPPAPIQIADSSLNSGSGSASGERIIIVEPLRIGKEKRRKGTSVVALKSPYPWPQREDVLERVKTAVGRGLEGVKGLVGKVSGKLRSKM